MSDQLGESSEKVVQGAWMLGGPDDWTGHDRNILSLLCKQLARKLEGVALGDEVDTEIEIRGRMVLPRAEGETRRFRLELIPDTARRPEAPASPS